MFDFHHEARANSTKSTCHSFGVQGQPRATLSINISLLAELCVWRAIDFDRMGNQRAKFRKENSK